MIKKIVALSIVLTLLVIFSAPAFATDVSNIITQLNAVKAKHQSLGTVAAIDAAIAWFTVNAAALEAHYGTAPGGPLDLVAGHISSALALTSDSLVGSTGNQAAIIGHIQAAANELGATFTPNVATGGFSVTGMAGTVPINFSINMSGDGSNVSPIKQTGFMADYSTLIVVSSLLVIILVGVIVCTIIIKRSRNIAASSSQ